MIQNSVSSKSCVTSLTSLCYVVFSKLKYLKRQMTLFGSFVLCLKSSKKDAAKLLGSMPPLTVMGLLEVSPKLRKFKENLDQHQSLHQLSSVSCSARNRCEVFV